MKSTTILFPWLIEGGSAKTTTTINVASALARDGKRVLAVDLDETGKLSMRLGINPETLYPTLSHVYTQGEQISKVVKKSDFGFDIIPGHPLLGALQDALEPGDEHLLKKHLAPVLADYDFVLLDARPGTHPLSYAALTAADYLIMPMRAQADSLKGVSQTIDFLRDVIWQDFNPDLKTIGILPVMVRRISPNALGVVKKARESWGNKVLPFEVPITDLFSKEFAEGTPAVVLNPKHEASQAYMRLAKAVTKIVDRDKAKAKKTKAKK